MAKKSTIGKFLGYELPPEERKQVLEELFVFGKENQRPFFARMAVLIVVSTIIATGGLLSNSAAVVIGAMLVAPMMRPVMAAAAAIALSWANRLYQSLLLILVMTICVVAISAGLTTLAPEMVAVPEQVMARTVPTFFDLVIALASGAGGAYVMTRKESSAIPGVAMAVSLLPPLASCGILLVFLEHSLALKSFVLFVTNFLAMTLAGAVTFLICGIASIESRRRSSAFMRINTLVFVMLVVAVSIPLSYFSDEKWYGAHYKAANSEELQDWLRKHNLELVDVRIGEKNQILYLDLVGPEPPLTIEGLHESIKKRRIRLGEYREFSIETVWTPALRSSWPPPSGLTSKPATLKIQDTVDTSNLVGVEWLWKQTQYGNSQWLESDNPEIYRVEFNKNNKVTGRVDCNTLRAEYQLSNNLLSLKDIVTTRSGCANPDLDTAFVNDLNRVVNFEVLEDRLVLQLNDNAGLMYFDKTRRIK